MKKTLPVIITLGVILLLGTLTSWVAPNIVRNYVCDNGEEILGRKIRINDLKANIFTGAISMEGLTVFEEDGIMPFIHLHRAETNLSMLHLLTGIIDLETLRLSQLDINIQQRDTVFNFTDILQRFSEEGEEEAEGGYPLVIRDIELSKSSIHYQDLLVRSNIRINDVNLHIPGIDLRDLVTNMGLDLEFVDGGKLTTQMSYNDRTRHYTIDLLLNDFSLEGILPYVQQAMWSEKLSGQLNADLKMEGSLSHILDFRLTGQADAHDIYMEDDRGDVVLSCDSVLMNIREMNLLENRISLSQMVAHQPSLYITYDKDSLDNFDRMRQLAEHKMAELLATLVKEESEDQVPSASDISEDTQPDFQLRIDQCKLLDGSLFYRDEATSITPFTYQVGGINLNAPNFSLNQRNHIRCKALMGNTGSITLDYQGKLDDERNLSLDIHAADVEITDFSPYTLQMFGNSLENGTLSADVQITTQDGNLTGNALIMAEQPMISKKQKGIKPEMPVPFRTAINLLTDRNGHFQINVPISGSIDEPQFSYKRIIFRLIGKMFIRVCTFGYRNKNLPTDSLRLSTIYNDFDIDDINIEEFANDSIGEVLLNED